jgi:hypothetical protein
VNPKRSATPSIWEGTPTDPSSKSPARPDLQRETSGQLGTKASAAALRQRFPVQMKSIRKLACAGSQIGATVPASLSSMG